MSTLSPLNGVDIYDDFKIYFPLVSGGSVTMYHEDMYSNSNTDCWIANFGAWSLDNDCSTNANPTDEWTNISGDGVTLYLDS